MKTTFKVADMHCSMCAMKLEGLEDKLPGIRQITASYHRQEMRVDFDESLVSLDEIIRAAAEEGYTAVVEA